jgi:hypothetical protein
MIVDTTNQVYQDLLAAHLTIKRHLRDRYKPVLERMSPDQICELASRDPLLKDVFIVSLAVAKFARTAKAED